MNAQTHVTKVLTTIGKACVALGLCLLLLLSADGDAQVAQPVVHASGPAEALYLQLSHTELDASRVFRVRDASIDRPSLHVTLEDGTIAFTKDVMGRITGAFFEGDGEVLLTPPSDVERKSISLFTGMAILEERFSTAYFRFNDNSPAELQPGLRAPEEPEQFVARWNDTARNLADADAMRLLASFIDKLPVSMEGDRGVSGSGVQDPNDRMFHARIQGNKLGVFDVLFDSLASEQVQAGQAKTAENGILYYNVWTSFAVESPRSPAATREEISETVPDATQSREDPILVRNYVIDAHVNPPKQLDAEVEVHLDVVRGGSRLLMFELSRFLEIHNLEVDGRPIEFIQNPAVEGTRLARSGNDMVAVILPRPARRGQKITLRFFYGGEVLAEAGKGLLYVGARGNWYPNRGLAMADYDLTFHYPQEWTLVATGKAAPIQAASQRGQREPPGADPDQVKRFVSERPIPIAGFNLGKYVRSSAQAGNITVETYATGGVEREFAKPSVPAMDVEPKLSRPPSAPSIRADPSPAAQPSPAKNATAVAQKAARAIDYFSARFGPYPYGQLALTQMPGRESQGWPGLVFLSSYAFLTPSEQQELHTNPADALIGELIPAHETAHQWWGDLITWETYHDQWFSEGLANYCALMMMQEKNPADFHQMMEHYRQALANKNKDGNVRKDAGPVTLGSRLLSSQFPEGYEAISYGRASWLFYMLHSILLEAAELDNKGENRGSEEDPFVRSLHKLRERYAGKAITTRELLNVFAENLPARLRYEGKPSLDWFLKGWINGTSLPELELHNVKFVTKGNSTSVTGVIRQKQAEENLVTVVPIYAAISGKAPLLISLVFADGPESSFHLSAPAGTRKLLLDPYETILTAPK